MNPRVPSFPAGAVERLRAESIRFFHRRPQSWRWRVAFFAYLSVPFFLALYAAVKVPATDIKWLTVALCLGTGLTLTFFLPISARLAGQRDELYAKLTPARPVQARRGRRPGSRIIRDGETIRQAHLSFTSAHCRRPTQEQLAEVLSVSRDALQDACKAYGVDWRTL